MRNDRNCCAKGLHRAGKLTIEFSHFDPVNVSGRMQDALRAYNQCLAVVDEFGLHLPKSLGCAPHPAKPSPSIV